MAFYNFEEPEKRLVEILKNNEEIEEKNVPKDDSEFTYSNGIKSWIGSIFVDIVKSSDIIGKEEDIKVSKILRSFSSELITIMNSSNNVREIGIRGDCVYGIYNTPYQKDIYELVDISAYINTCIKMLNKLFQREELRQIRVGIGVSVGQDLIVKAGKKGSGINDKIWIGNAVVKACNLANVAGRNGKNIIAYSKMTYDNFINVMIEDMKNKDEQEIKGWFKYDYNENAYFADIIYPNEVDWMDKNI